MCTRRASEWARCRDRAKERGREREGEQAAAVKSKQKAANQVENVNKRCAPKSPTNFWVHSTWVLDTQWERGKERERIVRELKWESTIEHNSTIFVACDKLLTYLTMNACQCVCERVCLRGCVCCEVCMCVWARSRALLPVAFVALFWQSLCALCLRPVIRQGRCTVWETDSNGSKKNVNKY